MEALFKFLKKLIDNKFYGSIEIKFEAGKVSIIRKVESIKIQEVP